MKKRIFGMIMAAAVALMGENPASGAGEAGVRLDREATLWVERGDTLLGLFGPDLMKVVERNRELIPSPHWLGEGLEIVVPAYTYLSPRAVDHLNRDRHLRQEARTAVEKALAAQKTLRGEEGSAVAVPAYAESQKVLARALQALKEQPPNYLAAREWGQEAARLLAISSGQVRLAAKMEEIERRHRRVRIAAFLLILALGARLSVCILRRAQHNARLREEIEQRLQGHFRQFQKL